MPLRIAANKSLSIHARIPIRNVDEPFPYSEKNVRSSARRDACRGRPSRRARLHPHTRDRTNRRVAPGRAAAHATRTRLAPPASRTTPLSPIGPEALCTAHAALCNRAASPACHPSQKSNQPNAITRLWPTRHAPRIMHSLSLRAARRGRRRGHRNGWRWNGQVRSHAGDVLIL